MNAVAFTIDQAAIITGGLLLEHTSKAVLMPDSQLESYYEPALQNFKDFCQADYGLDFEPTADFKQKVMDEIRWYLDRQHKRFDL